MFLLQGYCTGIVSDTMSMVLTVHHSDSLWKINRFINKSNQIERRVASAIQCLSAAADVKLITLSAQ